MPGYCRPLEIRLDPVVWEVWIVSLEPEFACGKSTREIGAWFGDLTQTPKTTFFQPAHARHDFRYRRTMSGGSDRGQDAKDAGKEFYNKHLQALMKRTNIHHSPLVKRKTVSLFHRQVHVDLPTCAARLGVGLQEEVLNNLRYTRNAWSPNEIEIRYRVKLNKKFRIFQKGYLPSWTDEVFDCSSSIRCHSQLVSWTSGTVNLSAPNIHRKRTWRMTISFGCIKIVQRKGDKGLVLWWGWPDKYGIWIEKRHLLKTHDEGGLRATQTSFRITDLTVSRTVYKPFTLRFQETGW